MSTLKLLLFGAALVAAAYGASAASCTLDGNPSCASAVNMGALAGDVGTQTLTYSGVGEAYLTVRLREDATSTRDLSIAIRLQSPPDMNYDLVVRCASCTSTTQRKAGGPRGVTDEIRVVRRDGFADNSVTLVIEVRFREGSSCAPWTLTIAGNVGGGTDPLICN
jgi:hypothetical protein